MLFGGRVRHFLPFWCSITSDEYILSLVDGISVPFTNGKLPKQKFIPPQLAMTDEEMHFVDAELEKIIEHRLYQEIGSHVAKWLG